MALETSLLRKIFWTLLVGFLSFSITSLFDQVLDVSLADQLIVTVFIGGATLMVQYLADVDRRLKEFDRLQRATAEDFHRTVKRGFASIDEAAELMSEIEQSPLRQDLLKKAIRRSALITEASLPLVQFLANSETRRLVGTLESLSDGHELFYDGEDREFMLALTKGASQSLLATSFASISTDPVTSDVDFWLSDLGARYMDAQRAAVRRGVMIQRVFVVESPEVMANRNFQRVLAIQHSAGIVLRIAGNREAAQDGGLSEFVVFDEQVFYDTTLVSRNAPGAPVRVSTRIALTPDITRHQVERFNELWEKAVPFRVSDLGDDSAVVAIATDDSDV